MLNWLLLSWCCSVLLIVVWLVLLCCSIGCCSISCCSIGNCSIALMIVSLLQPLSLPQPSHREKLAHFLEQRSKEGLMDSETVAQHQRMNRNMMSQKMMEMTRLQNSLTDQAKVCMLYSTRILHRYLLKYLHRLQSTCFSFCTLIVYFVHVMLCITCMSSWWKFLWNFLKKNCQ